MADRRDFYYRQKVLEDELDAPFDALETSDWRIVGDLGLGRRSADPGTYGGIAQGFTATHLSGLDMSLAAGAAYREDGKRVGTAASYVVNVSNTGTVATGKGGTGNGTTTNPGAGNKRVVSIFIGFDRLLSDMRYDGYNNQVYFKRNESFYFYLTMGAPKTISDPTDPVPPVRESDKFLLVDVIIQNPSGTVTYASHSQARLELELNLIATNPPNRVVRSGWLREGIRALLEYYNEHVNGNADRHPATDIPFPPGTPPTGHAQIWADGTGGNYGVSTSVFLALEGIVYDIARTVTVSGTQRVGARAQTGTLTTPPYSSRLNLVAGTLDSQLKAIMDAVNGRVFRGGDDGIAGRLAPATDGTALGSDGTSWDAFIRDLKVKGTVRSALYPAASGTYDLGVTGNRWYNLWCYQAHVTDIQAYTATFAGAVLINSNLTVMSGLTNVQEFTASEANLKTTVIESQIGATGLTIQSTGAALDAFYNALLKYVGGDNNLHSWLGIKKMGSLDYGRIWLEDFNYQQTSPASGTISAHVPQYQWKAIGSDAVFQVTGGTAIYEKALSVHIPSKPYTCAAGARGPQLANPGYLADSISLIRVNVPVLASSDYQVFVGMADEAQVNKYGLYFTRDPGGYRNIVQPIMRNNTTNVFGSDLNASWGEAALTYVMVLNSSSQVMIASPYAVSLATLTDGPLSAGNFCPTVLLIWSGGGSSVDFSAALHRFHHFSHSMIGFFATPHGA